MIVITFRPPNIIWFLHFRAPLVRAHLSNILQGSTKKPTCGFWYVACAKSDIFLGTQKGQLLTDLAIRHTFQWKDLEPLTSFGEPALKKMYSRFFEYCTRKKCGLRAVSYDCHYFIMKSQGFARQSSFPATLGLATRTKFNQSSKVAFITEL